MDTTPTEGDKVPHSSMTSQAGKASENTQMEQHLREVDRAKIDEYMFQLLSHMDNETSVNELLDKVDIPIATAYRRLSSLRKMGLVKKVGDQLSEDHRREDTYVRVVDGFTVEFKQGTWKIKTKESNHHSTNL